MGRTIFERMADQEQPFAVYHYGLGYDDETYHVDIDPDLQAQVAAWQSGQAADFDRAWAQATQMSDFPPEMASAHATLLEAQRAAIEAHHSRCEEITLIDLGFHGFGIDGSGDDLGRLRAWCEANDVPVPLLDPALPGVRVECEKVVARSLEGEMWNDFIDEGEEGAGAFAADIVVDELRRSGRADLIGELYAELVGSFTFVGPAIGVSQKMPKNKGGFFGRLFGK